MHSLAILKTTPSCFSTASLGWTKFDLSVVWDFKKKIASYAIVGNNEEVVKVITKREKDTRYFIDSSTNIHRHPEDVPAPSLLV